MTERAKRASGQPSRARSGEHPAVQAYRAKLESLNEGTAAATLELDRALEEFLADLKSTPPPPPAEAEATSKTKAKALPVPKPKPKT